jgi:hypothetical protein
MNFSKASHNLLSEVIIYSVLITVSTFAALLAVKNIKLSPDSMTYSLVSQQILSGNGIRIPMIWFSSSAVPVNGTVPMLMHPPFFAILLAILGGVTPQNYLPAQILNVICHILISIFTYLLMKNLFYKKWFSLLTGILVSVSFPLLRVTHHIWSETLFISLTIASVYFLTISRHSIGNRYYYNLFLASITTSAAILTRNTGIVILALFLWEAIVLIKNKKPGIKYVFIAMILPILTIIMLYYRNYMVSGLIRGYVQFEVEHSFWVAITGTLKMLFSQFHLGKRSIVAISILVALYTMFIILNSNARKALSEYLRSGLDLIIIFIVAYITLICIAMIKMQPQFELRFMSPLVPFLFILGVFSIIFIFKIMESNGFYALSLTGIILSLTILTSVNLYKTYLALPEFFHKQKKLYSILNSCTYKWLEKYCDKKNIIVTNKPYHLSFFGGYSTVVLPHKEYINIQVPEDMGSILPVRMAEIGAKILVLFNKVEKEDFGIYIAKLFFERKNYDKFTLVYKCPDGVVYKLKE